jgi:formate dehydrogenase major subunit
MHRDDFPIGKARLEGVSFRPPQELPNKRFPFTLTTGRLLPQFHTGTMTRKTPGIDALAGAAVEIAPGDADRLGVSEGDLVELSTPRGSLTAPARVTNRVPEGTLFMAFHFAEAPVNLLTNPARDPQAGIPELKVCSAALKKADHLFPAPRHNSRT